MTDLETALNAIDGTVDAILNPLVESGDATEIVYGTKDRKAPEPPFIRVAYIDDATIETTTIGGMGNNEAWIQPIRIGSTIKELDNPRLGFKTARALISKARNLLLANRQFYLPEIVRNVDSSKIQTVPYPFGKKSTLYGAGTILNVHFIIDNKI